MIQCKRIDTSEETDFNKTKLSLELLILLSLLVF